MVQKSYLPNGKTCRVTFRLPAPTAAQTATLCGDFTEWQQKGLPMKRLKDGSFSLTVSLPLGQSYRFRYLLDAVRWTNESAADSQMPNPYGSNDSVVTV